MLTNRSTTPESIIDWIQSRLNNNDVKSVRKCLNINLREGYNKALWDKVMQYTFNINSNDGRIIKDNTLLHVGIYVEVDKEIIGSLLDIGNGHYAYLHVNSDNYTPKQFANSIFGKRSVSFRQISDYVNNLESPIDQHLMDLLRKARDAAHPSISEYTHEYEGNKKGYRITVDLLPLPDTEGYSLFNSADAVTRRIRAFIDVTIDDYNYHEANQKPINKDEIYFTTEGTTVTFMSDNEDILGILFKAADMAENEERIAGADMKWLEVV